MRRFATILAVLGLLACSSLPGAGPAQAHAYLIATDPANGATVDRPPAAVQVTLSESVTLPPSGTVVEAVDAAGASVLGGAPRTAGPVLTIALKPGLPQGIYIVSWRLISTDTHTVAGSIQFGVGVPAIPVAAPDADQTADVGDITVRSVVQGLVYAGLVLALGGLLAARMLLGVTMIRLGLAGVIAAALGTVLQALVTTGIQYIPGLTEWFLLRLVALAVLAVVPRRPVVVVAAGMVAVVATVRVGHAAVSVGAWVVTSVHAAAAILWAAGLLVLVTVALRRRLAGAELARLRQWSVLSATSVALLILSGTLRAVPEVGAVPALWSTFYGRTLAAKMIAAMLALAAAGAALRWLRRQPADGIPPAAGQTAVLRTRVQWEAGAVTVATLLAMVLSNLTPAAVAYRPAETVHATIGPYTAEIRIDPARTGTEQITVTLSPREPRNLAPERLTGVLQRDGNGTLDGARSVPFPVRVGYPAPPGQTPVMMFRSAAVSVPTQGTWALDLTVVADQWNEYVGRVRYRVG